MDGQTEMSTLVEVMIILNFENYIQNIYFKACIFMYQDLRKEKEELETSLLKQLKVKQTEYEELQSDLGELKSQIQVLIIINCPV